MKFQIYCKIFISRWNPYEEYLDTAPHNYNIYFIFTEKTAKHVTSALDSVSDYSNPKWKLLQHYIMS